MRSLQTSVHIIAASIVLLGVQSARANRERPRSLEEMQTASALIVDGVVMDVAIEEAQTSSSEGSGSLLVNHYKAPFKIERAVKGQIIEQVVTLVYSCVVDPRFEGDNPPVLRTGDRFRLFADKVEGEGTPLVIRVRSINSIRPEAYEAQIDLNVYPRTEFGEEVESPRSVTPTPAREAQIPLVPRVPTPVQQPRSAASETPSMVAETESSPPGFPIVRVALLAAVIIGMVTFIIFRKMK